MESRYNRNPTWLTADLKIQVQKDNVIVKTSIDHCGGYPLVHSYNKTMTNLEMRLSFAFNDTYVSKNPSKVITYVREKKKHFKGELVGHNSLGTLTEPGRCS